jgi:phage N-6-adenine-methyltransferase
VTQFNHQYRKESNRLKDEWRTPPELFGALNSVFDFTLDVAATDDNALCERYFTADHLNGLNVSWRSHRVYANPPYSEGQYGTWLQKAADEWNNHQAVSVLLVPASLETDAFKPVWKCATYLVLPYKRLSFLLPDGKRVGGAPFASAIAIFGSPKTPWEASRMINSLTEIGHTISLCDGYRSKYR